MSNQLELDLEFPIADPLRADELSIGQPVLWQGQYASVRRIGEYAREIAADSVEISLPFLDVIRVVGLRELELSK